MKDIEDVGGTPELLKWVIVEFILVVLVRHPLSIFLSCREVGGLLVVLVRHPLSIISSWGEVDNDERMEC